MESFKRRHMEQAVWRHFDRIGNGGNKSPARFLTRIKRLLEVDRDLGCSAGIPGVPDGFAFFNEGGRGRGADIAFSAFNVFCIAVAVDLLDAGLKQLEVVKLIRHMRRDLESHYGMILKSPPGPSFVLIDDEPGLPSFEQNNLRFADPRVFVVMERAVIREARVADTGTEAMLFTPKFVRGIEALRKVLHKMDIEYRTALVIELAHTADAITNYLKAPAQR
ncbi:MAG: hypothetical protein ACPGO3_07365 [Magnetospiraceae bacterium]